MLIRLFRFGIVGVIGTSVHYLALILLVEGGGAGPVGATIVGSAVGAAVNYVLNRRYTFRSRKAHRGAVPRFLLVAVGTGILNAGLVYLGTDLLGMHYLLVQVGATLVVFLVNFLLNSVWTFRDENAA